MLISTKDSYHSEVWVKYDQIRTVHAEAYGAMQHLPCITFVDGSVLYLESEEVYKNFLDAIRKYPAIKSELGL